MKLQEQAGHIGARAFSPDMQQLFLYEKDGSLTTLLTRSAVLKMTPFTAEQSIFEKLLDKSVPPDATDLTSELSCDILEALYPHLDLITRKSSSHIDALHVHLRKRREIHITESASLHLIWEAGAVYIKPLPPCLFDLSFWDAHLPPGSNARRSAIGFVRTYAHLIRHRSDFNIALAEDLIPPLAGDLLHSGFEKFIQAFRGVGDAEVSRRWEFGQIRLGWLNWAVRVFQPRTPGRTGLLGRLFYADQYQQTGQFIREFGPPLLFIFATLSLILSAMQVVLGAKDGEWRAFAEVSAWFSVVVIVVLVAVFLGLGVVAGGVLGWQLGFAMRSRRG